MSVVTLDPQSRPVVRAAREQLTLDGLAAPVGRRPLPVLRRPVDTSAPTVELASTAPTLDDLLVSTWEGLIAGRAVACPVCGTASLVPSRDRLAGGVMSRCEGCGSSMQ